MIFIHGKILSSALITCHIDYACCSWYSGVSQKLKQKLQTTQNKVARFILNKHNRTHIGKDELNKIGQLCIEDRISQLKLNHVHKIFHGTSVPYMNDKFVKVSSSHQHMTRNSLCGFYVPKSDGQICNTFFYTGIREWNNLPQDIQMIKNRVNFKMKVKGFYSINS